MKDIDQKVNELTAASYWLKTGERNKFPELKTDMETEVAVVGAGIGGILTAYQLMKRGMKVTLFERFRILNGTTGNTTAKLSAQHGLIYQKIADRYDEKRAGLYYKANMDGIREIKRIAKELGLTDFVEDEIVYAYTTDEQKVPSFEKESKIYKKLGINGEYLKETPLHEIVDIKAALSMNDQGIFHPVEFLSGVLNHAVSQGLKVYEHTLVNDLKEKEDGRIELSTANGPIITCDYAVFTTHYPQIEKDDHYDQLHARTTQTLAYETDRKLFDGAHIAYDTPSVTLRTMEYFGKHYFLIGGQSHTTGDRNSDEERYEKIAELAKRLFGVDEPAFKWSTHDLMTLDHIPFIGRLHPDIKNAYTITGLNAWGLANSSAGAMLIADCITGKENPYVAMYDPFREISKIKADEEKEKSSSKVSKVAQKKIENLEPGGMTTITHGEKEVGVYKDENGKVHYLDLACTHRGCGLGLNDGDHTWDCPCHGSRFNKEGHVIYGPAMDNLKKIKTLK